MKIVHVIIGLNVGGAELMLRRLIESYKHNADYVHVVVSLTELGVIGGQLNAQGVQVITVGMRNAFDMPRALYELTKIIRKMKPDIVQTWMYHSDFLGGLAAYLAGVRNIVWGVRTTDIRKGGARATIFIRRICAVLSFFLPKIIICAAEAAKSLHVKIGYDSKRMVVIPNGFDLSRLSATALQRYEIRRELGVQDADLVVGSLGRYNPVKDHANIISAAGILAGEFQNLKFMLVGRDMEPCNVVLMGLIAETGYANRFILVGERQDVAAYLNAMDIFCLHSKTEGFPNALGEAMAMALPCVTTDVGDAAFLLGNNGIVVPSQNADALAEGLKKMIEIGSEARRELGRNAKARIIAEFSMDSIAARYSKIYEGLLLN